MTFKGKHLLSLEMRSRYKTVTDYFRLLGLGFYLHELRLILEYKTEIQISG